VTRVELTQYLLLTERSVYMHTITIGKYTVVCDHKISDRISRDIKDAVIVETLPSLDEKYGEFIYYGVTDCSESPDLIIKGIYSPSSLSGFYPELLIIPESGILFFGAGEIIQIWELSPYKKIHEESPNCGFWGWSQYNDVVLMSAELELACWNTKGKKLWSRFVEPPWYYTVEDDVVTTNVMNHQEKFNIYTGK
jgi:hypothetical protein